MTFTIENIKPAIATAETQTESRDLEDIVRDLERGLVQDVIESLIVRIIATQIAIQIVIQIATQIATQIAIAKSATANTGLDLKTEIVRALRTEAKIVVERSRRSVGTFLRLALNTSLLFNIRQCKPPVKSRPLCSQPRAPHLCL